jgi:hypothetical protein
MRDPALAALMGIVPGPDFGDDYGAFGGDYNGDMYGAFGADAPPAPAPAGTKPAPAQLMSMWHAHQAALAKTHQRHSILEPNAGSTVNVERYSFSINPLTPITLGTTSAVTAQGNPQTKIRPQRVTINAPAPGFLTVVDIKVANVSVQVGGVADAWDFNALGVGQSLDMPTIEPANQASFIGTYSGYTPPGFVSGSTYALAITFKGPSSMAA